MLQLSNDEFANLKSQIVTSSWGGSRRAKPLQIGQTVFFVHRRRSGKSCRGHPFGQACIRTRNTWGRIEDRNLCLWRKKKN